MYVCVNTCVCVRMRVLVCVCVCPSLPSNRRVFDLLVHFLY